MDPPGRFWGPCVLDPSPAHCSLTTLVEEGPSLTGHALKATMVGAHNHSVVPFKAVSGAHRRRNL